MVAEQLRIKEPIVTVKHSHDNGAGGNAFWANSSMRDVDEAAASHVENWRSGGLTKS